MKSIAENYEHIYQRIEFRTHRGYVYDIVTHPLRLIEYKADFDRALQHVGKTIKTYIKYKDFTKMRDYLNGED